MSDAKTLPAESLARRFHEIYERLAPSYGYETRAETRAFDPTTPNGRLMIAVCAEIAAPLAPEAEAVLREVECQSINVADLLEARRHWRAAGRPGLPPEGKEGG